MADSERWRPQTLAAQALGWIDEATRAVIPPIHLATTFIRDADNQDRTGRSYGRGHHPTYDAAEPLARRARGRRRRHDVRLRHGSRDRGVPNVAAGRSRGG